MLKTRINLVKLISTITRLLLENNFYPSQELNPGPLNYEPGTLSTEPLELAGKITLWLNHIAAQEMCYYT